MVELPSPTWLPRTVDSHVKRLEKLEEEMRGEQWVAGLRFPKVGKVGGRRRGISKKVAAHTLSALPAGTKGVVGRMRKDDTHMDLSGSQINDADIVAVTCSIHAYTSITSLDLSSNPITDAGASILLGALQVTKTITTANLANTLITPPMLRKIRSCTDANRRHQLKQSEIQHHKELVKFLAGLEETFLAKVKTLRAMQNAEYTALVDDYNAEHRGLRMQHTVELKNAKKKEYTKRMKIKRQRAKRELITTEETLRWDILEEEEERMGRIVVRGEELIRRAICAGFETSIKSCKQLEKEQWTLTRRKEKHRIAENEAQRAAVGEEEDTCRTSFMRMYHATVEKLEKSESLERKDALERLRTREEAEEEERRRKEAEERRLEYEALCKKERCLLEAFRREQHQKGERLAVEGKEEAQRKHFAKDENAAFSVILEMSAVNITVAKAKSDLSHWETKLLKSWSEAPTLTITPDPSVSRVFYDSPTQGPLSLDLGLSFAHNLVPPTCASSFEQLKQRVDSCRVELKKELPTASVAVRNNAVRWNEVLHYGHKPQGRPALGPYGGLVYNASGDKGLEEPVWLCDKGFRLQVRGGCVEVFTEGGAVRREEFIAPFGHFTSSESPSPNRLILTLPPGTTMETLQVLTNTVQYRHTSGAPAPPFTKSLVVRVTLVYPALASADPGRFFDSVEEAFGATVSVTKEVRPVVVIAPLPLRKLTDKPIEWYEARDDERIVDDKGVAVLGDTVITPPPCLEGGEVTEELVGGSVVCLRVTDNASLDDQIVLKTGEFFEDDSHKTDIDLSPTQQITYNGSPVASIIQGKLPSLREAWGLGPCSPNIAAHGFAIEFNQEATFTQFHKVLKRLKYIIIATNLLAPQERRQVEIVLTDRNNNQCTFYQSVDIYPSDKPTTMTIGKERLFYRALAHPSVSADLRQHLKPQPLALFAEAVVTDIDTDHFQGGVLLVQITSGACRGDQLFLNPHNEHGITVADRCILYRGEYIGVLYEGAAEQPPFDLFKEDPVMYRRRSSVLLSRKKTSDASTIVRVKFPHSGAATLDSVQAILRCICYMSSYYTPMEGMRSIIIEFSLGPAVKGLHTKDVKDEVVGLLSQPWEMAEDEEVQTLTCKREVKVTGPMFDLPPSHAMLEYKEGSGSARLAPIDLTQELDVSYDGGYVRVEVVMGGCDDDFLSVKAGVKEEFKVRERKGVSVELPNVNEPLRPEHGLQPSVPKRKQSGASEKRVFDPAKISKVGKLMKATALLGATSELKRSVQAFVKTAESNIGSDLWNGPKYFGTIVSMNHQLLIRFAGKVTKKDVAQCLRSLSYTNVSNGPKILDKVLRITLKGKGESVSQITMQVEIKPVDDVTEFIIPNQRVRYRPGQLSIARQGCFPLTEMGPAYLVDPDTPFFDGGKFTVEFTSGAVKGDTLGFMTTAQQNLVKQNLPVTGERAQIWEGTLVVRNQTILTQDDLVVANVELLKSSFPGVANLRLNFACHDPPQVSIELASYMMNCITFSSHERITPGHRAIQFKISDVENPEEGKEKLVIDCTRPLLGFPGKSPFRHVKPLAYGSSVSVIDRVTINMGDGKSSSIINQGYTSVTMTAGHEDDTVWVGGETLKKQTVGAAAQHSAERRCAVHRQRDHQERHLHSQGAVLRAQRSIRSCPHRPPPPAARHAHVRVTHRTRHRDHQL